MSNASGSAVDTRVRRGSLLRRAQNPDRFETPHPFVFGSPRRFFRCRRACVNRVDACRAPRSYPTSRQVQNANSAWELLISAQQEASDFLEVFDKAPHFCLTSFLIGGAKD